VNSGDRKPKNPGSKSQANVKIKHRKLQGERSSSAAGDLAIKSGDGEWLAFLGLGICFLIFVWVLKLGAWDLIECRPLDPFDAR
jgi:hypothetical protein